MSLIVNKKLQNDTSIIENTLNKNVLKIRDLDTSVLRIETQIEKQDITIALLKNEIEKIQNSVPEKEKRRFDIIKCINDIQILINNKKDYADKITELKILSDNNEELLLEVKSLSNFTNIPSNNDLINVFDKESKKLFFVEHQKGFFDSFVKLKKIKQSNQYKDTEESVKAIKNELQNIQYVEALELITENNFSDELTETCKILQDKINLIELLDKIILLI